MVVTESVLGSGLEGCWSCQVPQIDGGYKPSLNTYRYRNLDIGKFRRRCHRKLPLTRRKQGIPVVADTFGRLNR